MTITRQDLEELKLGPCTVDTLLEMETKCINTDLAVAARALIDRLRYEMSRNRCGACGGVSPLDD